MNSEEQHEQPRILYLQGYAGCPQRIECRTETRAGWWHGSAWRPKERLYKRSEYRLVTKEDYEEAVWAHNHVNRIVNCIYHYGLACTPAQLRQIAAIIGYEEQ